MTLDSPARRGDDTTAPRPARSGWPLPLPTSRAVACLVGTGALCAGGALIPFVGWAGLAATVVVLVGIAADGFAAPGPRRFAARRVPRADLRSRREETLGVELHDVAAPESSALASLRAVDDLPPTFERRREPAPLVVAPGERVTLQTVVMPARRGRHALGAFHVRTTGPLGLAERDLVFDLDESVRVVPGLASVDDTVHVLRRGRRTERGVRRTRRRGDGSAFESLRDHVPGDDLRKTDWKASARHGRLIQRQFELDRNESLVVLLDCGRWMSSVIGDDPAGPTRLDHVVDVVILLAQLAAIRDDRVGVLAFSDKVLRWVPPAKGRAAVRRIVDEIFDLEPSEAESDYAAAFAHLRIHQRKRALVVTFTDMLSEASSRIVSAELRRTAQRHVPLCVTLRDLGLDALAGALPETAESAFRAAAADDLLTEREAALDRLRDGGVHVVDADPRRIGPPLVEKYLDLRSRTSG